MNKLIYFTLSLSLIFVACKGSKKSSTEEIVEPIVKEVMTNDGSSSYDFTSLGLKRSSCYGKCPTFEYIVQSDGSFSYHGRGHVDNLGKYVGKLSESSARALWEKAKDLNLAQYKRDYSSGVTDVPISTLKIGRADSLQLIGGDMDLPAPIVSLMDHLDSLSKSFPMKLIEANVPRNAIPGEVIVELKSGVTPEEVIGEMSDYNLVLKNRVAPALSYYVLTFDATTTNAGILLADLKNNDKIKEAQFNQQTSQRDN